MRTLASFIHDISPKFNAVMMNGLAHHRMMYSIHYIDRFIKYGCQSKTQTHLRYLGYKELAPKDEIKYLFNKTGRTEYDIAENSIYLVEFYFQYGESDEVMKHLFYLPYVSRGNTINLSGSKMLVMPVLADKVISIGEHAIFINILTAKYNFKRTLFAVVVDGRFARVKLVNTELYRNQSKKQEDTTKANTTALHYLVANDGYTAVMQRLLGFVPVMTYKDTMPGYVIVKSTGEAPQGYIKNKKIYSPTPIRFAVKQELYSEKVLYVLGNLLYVIDNFPEVLAMQDFDDTIVWKRLLSEIIHSGNHGLYYLAEKIGAHFNDLNSRFDDVTIEKLKDVGVISSTLIELIYVIFEQFNDWIMTASSRNLYGNKTYEVESFALSNLTSRITRIVLDINKEELREKGKDPSGESKGILEQKSVDKIFNKYFKPKTVFSLKNEKLFVTSIEYCGDHLYPKNVAMIVHQEADAINTKTKNANTSERRKISASMTTVGSILGLSKGNPTPVVRLNPYVNVDIATGTVLPNPLYNDIVEATDKMLSDVVQLEAVDIVELSKASSQTSEEDVEVEDSNDDEMDDDQDYQVDEIDID